MLFHFWSIVIVEKNLVWVVVKVRWPTIQHNRYSYEVYVRSRNWTRIYNEMDIKAFIYDKELSRSALQYYK